MIITTLTYKKPVSEVEKYLTDHVNFLNKYYAQKKFLASGRRDNRVGGVILVLSDDVDETKSIMTQDPFFQHKIADYDFIRFEPSKCLDEIKGLI